MVNSDLPFKEYKQKLTIVVINNACFSFHLVLLIFMEKWSVYDTFQSIFLMFHFFVSTNHLNIQHVDRISTIVAIEQ
jgi:hypothetical protein